MINDNNYVVVASWRIIGQNKDSTYHHICFHQGLILKFLPVALVIEELIRYIQNEVSWCMIFANDIVF